MKTLLLIDGHSIMHRAYHAIPSFRTSGGIPTNALYGFFSIIYREVVDFKPTHIVICFDTPAPTFRKKMFREYQAHRPKAEDEFKIQVPFIRDAIDKAGIARIEKEGYEGDDIIGTIAKRFKINKIRVLILSSDRDILQLVDENVFVILPQNGFAKNILYNIGEVKKKFTVTPQQIPDLKGLMGDPSDNYPGARGIGPKTAVLLIKQFGSIENVFANLDKIDKVRIKKILQDYKDDVFLSKKLATILTDVNLDFDIDKATFTWFNPGLKDYLLRFEIKSLAKRLFEEKNKEKKPAEKSSPSPENQMGLF